VSALVALALTALGPAASKREIQLVAQALRDSGDAEALALFGLPVDGEPDPNPVFDREACARVKEIAVEVSAGPFVGLDLYAWTVHPMWNPFPTRNVQLRETAG
jgi:hypothetical protein